MGAEFSVFAAAREVPDRVALLAEGQTLHFNDLAERVAVACARLDTLGLPPGARVAVCATSRLATVVLLCALMERGFGIVMVHPRSTPPEVATLLDDATPALALLDDDAVDAFVSGCVAGRAVRVPPSDRATLAVVYTSGTSGHPKGAVLSRRAFSASAAASARNLGWYSNDRWLLCLPLCHVGGLSVLTRCLAARRAVVLLPRFESAAVLNAVETAGVTLVSVVPTMLAALVRDDRLGCLVRLRGVLVGGAAAQVALREECAARRLAFIATYGLTEACSQVTAQRPGRRGVVESGCGPPLPGITVAVLDRTGCPAPPGVAGRVHVDGPMLMDGYWGGAPRVPGLFDTGDIGEIDARGALYLHARRTDLIVTGGENVYPLEVERALEGCPGVTAALVFGVQDETWGQLVCAAIVLAPGIAPDEPALQALLAARLAPYKRPRRVCFVSELPVLPGGKPDRRGAAARFSGTLRTLQRER